MARERLEWLSISEPRLEPRTTFSPDTLTRTCPACSWPNAEGIATCIRCGAPLGEAVSPDPTLPEHNITLSRDIVEWMRSTRRDAPEVWRLRLQAEQAQLATGFEQLICLDDIYIDQYPHQLDAALAALRDMRGRALLADEVGLGKTIEAGIVMKELVVRGLVRSVLILTPASLALQWQEEMETKFVESFEFLTRRAQIDDHADGDPLRWICSLERGKRADWAEKLLAREYDLLIVDEAHKLKNRRTQVHRFVNQIRKRYVLLLTATPVHNELLELYSLITILRPGHLGTVREFRRNFVYSGIQRRVITWQAASSALGHILRQRHPKAQTRRGWVGANMPALDIDGLPLPRPTGEGKGQWVWKVTSSDVDLGQQARDQTRELCARGYLISSIYAIRNESRNYMTRLRFMGARVSDDFVARNEQNIGKVHGFRIELVLPEADKTIPRNPASLRRLLNEVMIRNRRSHVGISLPRRRAGVYTLDLTPPERALYDGVTAYIRQHIQRAEKIGSLRMTLMTLQREVCSSPAAVAGTLQKMVGKPLYASSHNQLVGLLGLAESIQTCRKAQAVLRIIEQFRDKLLVFTDYRATMEYLYETLTGAGIETVRFHGGLSALGKEEAVRAFRQGAQVMISTESGAEGRNLQFCHQMVNYDLPWNPMRIEQRIGRIHRLGQTQEVLIFNLAGKGTIEAYILDLLARKIRMFELVVGELDLVLGNIDSKRSFEALLRDAWINSSSDQELARHIAELEALIDVSRRTFGHIQQASDALSDLLEAREEMWGYGLEPDPEGGR